MDQECGQRVWLTLWSLAGAPAARISSQCLGRGRQGHTAVAAKPRTHWVCRGAEQ